MVVGVVLISSSYKLLFAITIVIIKYGLWRPRLRYSLPRSSSGTVEEETCEHVI